VREARIHRVASAKNGGQTPGAIVSVRSFFCPREVLVDCRSTMIGMRTSVGGAPLPASIRQQLSALVAAQGEKEVAERVGFARQTLARSLCGLPVTRGTAALLREFFREEPHHAAA
jgi:hypothetical protein